MYIKVLYNRKKKLKENLYTNGSTRIKNPQGEIQIASILTVLSRVLLYTFLLLLPQQFLSLNFLWNIPRWFFLCQNYFMLEFLWVWISSMRHQLILPKKAVKFKQNPPYFFLLAPPLLIIKKKTDAGMGYFFRTLRPFQKTSSSIHTFYLKLLYVVWIFVCLDFTYVRISQLNISQNLPFLSLSLILLYTFLHNSLRVEISYTFIKEFVFREFGIGDQILWTFPTKCNKSNLTEEIQVSRRASDWGSYAKPLFVRALSSHSRV